jgi:microcystin degradation protein MlrC
MNTPTRIALGSIFCECNHFGGQPVDMAAFEHYELVRGQEVMRLDKGAVGGMLEILRERGATVAPLLVASTCPGGPLTADCYRRLKEDLLDRLRQALPVDGVLLALHGSATVANVGDLEGDLLAAAREIVGPDVPIVATLDLHAHVTALMVQNADALVAWETYPHRDAFSTGQRGARLLCDTLAGRCLPTMALAKVPVLTSGCLGHTEGEGPFADLMRYAKSHEGRGGVLSANVFLVHPYLDLPDMGSGAVIVTDNDMDAAATLAEDIARRYWDRRHDLEPVTYTPADAIRRGRQVDGGPVLLVETADCAGGGAACDSVHTLRALLEAGMTEPALAVVVDPPSAARCHHAGIGGLLTLELGHKLDPQWGRSVTVSGRVTRLSDGRFRYSGGIWEGTTATMGPSAVFRVGTIDVLIMTYATYDWADEQFRAVGLDPARAKFVVVKNPMNYRFGYTGVSKAAFLLDTPGPTPPTMRNAPYRRLARPYFPADNDIPGLRPTVVRGRAIAGNRPIGGQSSSH